MEKKLIKLLRNNLLELRGEVLGHLDSVRNEESDDSLKEEDLSLIHI